MAGLFPVLTLISPTHEPGLLLQKLGKALQVTAGRFDLELNAGRLPEITDASPLQQPDTKEENAKRGRIDGKPSWSERRLSFEEGGGTVIGNQSKRIVVVQDVAKEKGVTGCKKSLLTSEEFVSRRDGLRRDEEGGHADDGRHTPDKSRNNKMYNEDVQLKIISNRPPPPSKHIDGQNENVQQRSKAGAPIVETNYADYQKAEGGDLLNRIQGEREAIHVDDNYDVRKDLTPNLEGERGDLNLCSPAHSRESMKTVGPLEKVNCVCLVCLFIND